MSENVADPVVFRLTQSFVPVSYKLLFVPRPSEYQFAASALLKVKVAEPLPTPICTITLHALQLSVNPKHVTLRLGEDAAEVRPCISMRISARDETISLDFAQPLPNGKDATFILDFACYAGVINRSTGSHGLFCSNFTDPNFLATQLEPTEARRLFPCFDEPFFRATFQLTLEYDSRYTIVTGTFPVREELVLLDKDKTDSIAADGALRVVMPLRMWWSSCNLGDGCSGGNGKCDGEVTCNDRVHLRSTQSSMCGGPGGSNVDEYIVRRVTFDTTPRICPSIVGFAIGMFQSLERRARRHLVCRVFFPTGIQANHGWYALDLLTKAVDFFEEYYDFHLPLQKLDLVSVGNFDVLGMENWGMITIHQDYLLVDKSTSIERRQRIARLIGHEVSHQWLGDWASVSWWKYVWLKEGLCRYLEFLFVDSVFPSWLMWDEFLRQIFDDALAIDSRPERTHPVECCNENPRRIRESFDSISYGKGSSILRTLFSILGARRLQTALNRLLVRSEHISFDTQIFLDCISEVSDDPTKHEMAEVILGYAKKSGHPLIYVEGGDDSCVVTQYQIPDLRDGILPVYVKMRQKTGDANSFDLTAPHRTGIFRWNAQDFLTPSNDVVPLSIMTVQHGASSSSKTFVLRQSRKVMDLQPGSLVYFNYGGTGLLRCDYDTTTWLRIFDIAQFLSSQDRTVITITLFQLRNVHIGTDRNDGLDKCTLLLEWLLLITQSSINSSQWTCITEHLERIVYMVRDYPCRDIFTGFVCALYAPLLKHGAVSFAAKEKTVTFESRTDVPHQTVLHILQVLAISRSPVIVEESKLFVERVLTTLIPSFTQSNSTSVYYGLPFNVEDEMDATCGSIAMQCLVDYGDSKIWWTLACVLGDLLGISMDSFASELSFDVLEVNVEHLNEVQTVRWVNMITPAVLAFDSNLVSPFLIAVIKLFKNVSTPVAKAILRNKSLVTLLFSRDTPNGSNEWLSYVRKMLIVYGSMFCADGNLIAHMKAAIASDVPFDNCKAVEFAGTTEGPVRAAVRSQMPPSVSNSIDAMETNCVWMDYCCDHYDNFLSRKRSSHAWMMPNSASRGSDLDRGEMGRGSVSI